MAMLTFALFITTANLILVSVLLSIYVRSYSMIKSKFNLGLVMFALFLVAQKLITIYFMMDMMDHDDILGTPMFVLEILEFFGFSSLVWITTK